MQENLTIARPYAQAAFEQAQADDQVAAWSDALALLGVMVRDPEIRRLINDPRVGRQRLVDLLLEVGGAGFFPMFRNFMKVLSAAQRLAIVPEIAEVFEHRRADAENIANVEVVSAFELSPAEAERIAVAIRKRLGKVVRVTQRLDRSLIGGAVARVGDTVYDLSLRGGLTQLANIFNRK